MNHTIGLIGAGAMGAALAGRLVANGHKILAPLEGRSPDSLSRARAAGMIPVPMADLATARLVLSVVPPEHAASAAATVAQALGGPSAPLYADLNAVSPATVSAIATTITGAGLPFVDGSIIGGLPRDGYAGPVIYVSGDRAADLLFLNDCGLSVKAIGGGIGAASALKMSYAAITKGHIALGAAAILAADRAGVRDALIAELTASQPAFLDGYRRSIPDMFPKAARWITEMQEIAAFLGPDRAEPAIWDAIADFYRQTAADHRTGGAEADRLRAALK